MALAEEAEANAVEAAGLGADESVAARSRQLGLVFWVSVVWIVGLVLVALLADLLPLRDPDEQGIITGEVQRYEQPGANAWFGGDGQGRDMLSRVIFGSRPALILALSVTVLSATLGTIVGLVAGYVRGRVDTIIVAITDLSFAFPSLVLLFAISATQPRGLSLRILIPVFTILGIAPYARITRSVALALAQREFVDAARSMGASRRRILFRELAPNVALPALAFAFLGFAIVIATEGALAFLGLGLEQTTWGSLIADGQGAIREASHLALIPATVMFVTIMAFNYIGDGIRQLADTRPVMVGVRSSVGDPSTRAETDPTALLTVTDLTTSFPTPAGVVTAVEGVSLRVDSGQSLGIVGESGSGKTMLLRSILGTFPVAGVRREGSVTFDGIDLLRAPDPERRRVLGTEIGVVSQNPLTALNPVRTIGSQLTETMRVHGSVSRAAAKARAIGLLDQVGIPEPVRRFGQFPHQLSGGMRQRVTIALALVNEPRVLLADEPTTALDVTIQDQILNLLGRLSRERAMALVLVTHDLNVVRDWTDQVAVMYAGQLVETGPTATVFAQPRHRYTEALLRSIPRLDQPSHSSDRCRTEPPPMVATAAAWSAASASPAESVSSAGSASSGSVSPAAPASSAGSGSSAGTSAGSASSGSVSPAAPASSAGSGSSAGTSAGSVSPDSPEADRVACWHPASGPEPAVLAAPGSATRQEEGAGGGR